MTHRAPLPEDPRSPLLFRAPNWIGDVVMALPALEALRRLRPFARLAVATRGPALAVVDEHPDVDLAIRLPSRREGDGEAVRMLASQGFGAALVLSPSFRSALQLLRARVPRRIGYAGDMRRALLTHVVGQRRGLPAAHQVRDYLDIAAFVGAAPVDPLPRIRPRDEHRRQARRVLDRLGAADSPLIAMAPFTGGGPTKRWPGHRFVELCVRLSRRGVRSVLIGGPEDGHAARRMRRRAEDRGAAAGAVSTLAGSATVPPVPFSAMASALPCLVTNDTGPMHLWAAGGGRVVALFGSSLPAFHGPLGPGHRVLHRESLPCAGCYRRSCPYGLECLRSIPVGEVFEQVEELLGDRDG